MRRDSVSSSQVIPRNDSSKSTQSNDASNWKTATTGDEFCRTFFVLFTSLEKRLKCTLQAVV